MNLQKYIPEDEPTTVDIDAWDDQYEKGTLACTNTRLVFVKDSKVADISLHSVNSVDYNGRSYPSVHLIWGLVMLSVGVLAWVMGPEIVDFEPLIGGATIGGIGMGIVILAIGFIQMLSHGIEIHTPSKTYKFKSRNGNLQDIVHAIRFNEPR